MPTFPHGDLRLELGSRLRALRRSYPVHTGVEVRVQIASDVFRVPDISMSFGYRYFDVDRARTASEAPGHSAPSGCRSSSPDDRIHDVLQKFEEYRAWGVKHIWLVEPELKRCYVVESGSLTDVSRLELPQFQFSVEVSDFFA